MNQTRLESFVEAWVNVVIGFTINYLANLVIIPYVMGVPLSLKANFIMGCFFTIVSVARSYAIRRWFNAGLHKAIHAITLKLLHVGEWRIWHGSARS